MSAIKSKKSNSSKTPLKSIVNPTEDNTAALEREKSLEEVTIELGKTKEEDRNNAIDAAKVLTQDEVIQQFNQSAVKLFTDAYNITVNRGKEREYKIGGYKFLYEKAVKMNKETPIDQFTLIILKYATDIYARNAEKFLKMDIPDEIKLESDKKNEFELIHSAEFKNLWRTLTLIEKDTIISTIVEMTQFAHIFFIQKILEAQK